MHLRLACYLSPLITVRSTEDVGPCLTQLPWCRPESSSNGRHQPRVLEPTARGCRASGWADNRDAEPGTDIREQTQDAFVVKQCPPPGVDPDEYDPVTQDQFRNAGGPNQNIYGAALTL